MAIEVVDNRRDESKEYDGLMYNSAERYFVEGGTIRLIPCEGGAWVVERGDYDVPCDEVFCSESFARRRLSEILRQDDENRGYRRQRELRDAERNARFAGQVLEEGERLEDAKALLEDALKLVNNLIERGT